MRQAIESLARAYLSADAVGNASAVTAAMAEADRLLAANPSDVGESRQGTDRVLILPPVVVEFEVFADERIVVVTVARYHRRG